MALRWAIVWDISSLTKYYDEFVLRGEQIFHGYSIYEVDGVFSGLSTIYEERTSVVKIIFKPDFIELHESGKFDISLKKMRNISRKYFGAIILAMFLFRLMFFMFLNLDFWTCTYVFNGMVEIGKHISQLKGPNEVYQDRTLVTTNNYFNHESYVNLP